MALAVVTNLAGNELCKVEVALSMRATDLKERIAQELGMHPYTFKLIAAGSAVEGHEAVSAWAEQGRIELSFVKLDGPTPDAQGYLRLQQTGEAPSHSWRRSRLQTTFVVLLLVALAAYFLIPFPYGPLVWYVAYLLEALFFNPTANGLRRLKQTESILSYMEEIRACRPVPEIKVQCYHMETRVRHVTCKDGTTRREVTEERVDTASFAERLLVNRWEDVTSDVVDGLGHFPLLQVHFEMKWEAADGRTQQAHVEQHERLRRRATAADSHYEFSENLKLLTPQGQECSFYSDLIGTTGDSFPSWLGFMPYVACCLLCLSWPYRYHLSKQAVKGDFVFQKRVWS